jgi:hypothetical protein
MSRHVHPKWLIQIKCIKYTCADNRAEPVHHRVRKAKLVGRLSPCTKVLEEKYAKLCVVTA